MWSIVNWKEEGLSYHCVTILLSINYAVQQQEFLNQSNRSLEKGWTITRLLTHQKLLAQPAQLASFLDLMLTIHLKHPWAGGRGTDLYL